MSFKSFRKNSIMSNPDFKFLYDLVEDIPEEKLKKKGKKKYA